MNKLATAAALLMISTSLAQAAWSKADFVKSYTDQGYSNVEVRMMGGEAKVQAVKDGKKVEIYHDVETGAVVNRGGSGMSATGGDDDDDSDHGGYGDDDHGGEDDDDGRNGADHD